MDAPADDFMVINQKNSDFSVFTHRIQSHTLTPSLPLISGITCRCSGGLRGCDQWLFPTLPTTLPIYLEIQAKWQVRWGFAVMRPTG